MQFLFYPSHHRISFSVIALAFLVLILSTSPVFAQSFTLKTIHLGHPANGDLLQFDHILAVSGHASDTR